jgi:hypothetical protein
MNIRNVTVDGQKLSKLRAQKRYASQQELAAAAEVALNTVWKAEKGGNVSIPCLKRIAHILEIDWQELVLSPDEHPPPPPTVFRCRAPTVFHCRGQFRELRALGDDGQVRELTRRCYYGEFKNAILTIHGTKADLTIDDVTMYDDLQCERSSHRLRGQGSFEDGSANILYTVEDQTRPWSGVCVLSVPRFGIAKIHGYWMTAGQLERGSTVLGILELELKSSEEAGDHNQREG